MPERRLSFFDKARVHVLAFIAQLLIRLIDLTLRWKFVGFENGGEHWTAQEPCALCFWHGHQSFMPKIYLHYREKDTRPIYALISEHGDGRVAATVLWWFRIGSVAGSTSHNARAGFMRLVRCIKGGGHIGITPDGPRGPVHKIKDGVVKLGQVLQIPIYPVAICPKRAWTFKSWDKMFIPKPFSEVVLARGEPILIPKDLTDEEFEEWRLKLENAMHEIVARGERELACA